MILALPTNQPIHPDHVSQSVPIITTLDTAILPTNTESRVLDTPSPSDYCNNLHSASKGLRGDFSVLAGALAQIVWYSTALSDCATPDHSPRVNGPVRAI